MSKGGSSGPPSPVLFGTFAAIGLVLAAIGVFSVMAYSVSLQTRDIGIRIALGPEPRGVLRMVLMKEAPLARLVQS